MTSPLPSGALRRMLTLAVAAATVPAIVATPKATAADATVGATAPTGNADGSRDLAATTRAVAIRSEIRWLHRRSEHLSQTIRFRDVRDPKLRVALPRLVQERRHWRQTFKPLRAIQRLSPRERFARWDAWMCIHRHEGPWNDPNGPYYGGLQMDYAFQQAYGTYLLRAKGTADNWTPVEQVAVAERAYRSRGFTPWPNTARACGLL